MVEVINSVPTSFKALTPSAWLKRTTRADRSGRRRLGGAGL